MNNNVQVEETKTVHGDLKTKRKKDRGYIWTLSPVVLWLLAFLTVPFIIVIVMSFFTRGVYGQVVYTFTSESYTRLLNPTYINILFNSLKISLYTTALCLVFGYPFAYYMAKSPKKYRTLLLILIIIPFWTNSLIRTYAWITLLRTGGIINSYLMKLGIIAEPLQMLYTDGAVLLGLVYTLFPFMVLPLYASIDNVDKAYLEAASDLGAPPWKTFMKVTLPLTMPGIVAGCLLVYIPTLGLFFIPDLMGGSKIMLISNLIKNQFLTARDWPFGSAISIVIIVITFVFIGVYFKLSGNKKTEVI